MSAESLPRYVDRWGFSSSPQPFICRELSAYSFILEGDLGNLQDLCDRYLNEPSNRQLDYRPLSPHVVLTFTRTTSLAAENPRYTELGRYPETEAAFWVLTARVEHDDKLDFVQRLAWFTPYIFVDNPVALSDGREIYGFPKEFGWFKLPNDADDSGQFGLEVLATKTFGTDAIGAQQPLLEVNQVEEGPLEFAERLTEQVTDLLRSHIELALPGVGLVGDLVDVIFHHQGSMVFLKQFYDAESGDRACYQAIIEAEVEFRDLHNPTILGGEYELTLHPLDSHPIAKDLGLKARQSAILSFRSEFDYTIKAGSTVWRAP